MLPTSRCLPLEGSIKAALELHVHPRLLLYHITYMLSSHFLLSFVYLVFYNTIQNKDASQEDTYEPTELTRIPKSSRA
jgi:alpha-N-acetylglucosamine transferase